MLHQQLYYQSKVNQNVSIKLIEFLCHVTNLHVGTCKKYPFYDHLMNILVTLSGNLLLM